MNVFFANKYLNQIYILFWYLFFLFVFIVSILDPQNFLGYRYYLLGILFIPYIINFIPTILNYNRNFIIILLAYAFPLWGVVMYLFRGVLFSQFTDTSYISFSIAFSIIFLLNNTKVNDLFKNTAIYTGVCFSLLIILTGIESLLGLKTTLFDFALSNDIARITLRDYDGFILPYIYFFASPILILPLAILIASKTDVLQNILFFLILVAFFLSGTRSHNIISIVFLVLFIKTRFNKFIVNTLFLFILCSSITLFYNQVYIVVSNVFSLNEDNNSYKVSMLSKYSSIISDPLTFFFGQGFQAVDWNSDLANMVAESATKTELTFLELIRVFGFFLANIFFMSIFYFIYKAKNVLTNYKIILLLALLFDSLFNPHLFSTYGAIICASVFSIQNKNNTKPLSIQKL